MRNILKSRLFNLGMSLRFFLIPLALAAPALASPTDDAIVLFKAKKYDDAREALEPIVAANPQDARACCCLGRVMLAQGHDAKAWDDALPWMEKAAKCAPNDPDILAAYGETAMQVAGFHTSISLALKGRDALDAALKLNPDDAVAHETLYQFYRQAPWPIGSSAQAELQLGEIRKLNPDRASVLQINAQIAAKDYAGAFKTCDELLAKNPDHPLALFNYGRTAAISGQNLERGLACLKKYIALAPSAANGPSLANAWGRIGNIYQKQGDAAAARTAYQTMLKLEPSNKSAIAALAQLK